LITLKKKKFTKLDLITFFCRRIEFIVVSILIFTISINCILYAFNFKILGIILSVVNIVGMGIFSLVVIEYKKWEKYVEENNTKIRLSELGENEKVIDLTPKQYETYIKEGYVLLEDGSPVISDSYKKSNKMKHIKLEDTSTLNGSIITEENKDYMGERVSDYVEKYGKDFGKNLDTKKGK